MEKLHHAKSGRFISVREAERRLKSAERLREMNKKASEHYRRRNEENIKQKIHAMASKLAREGEEQAMKLLKRAFEDTDTDKSGTICARELKQLFEKAGLHDTTDAEIQDMIKKCDKNNDSVLSFDEIAEGVKTSPYLHNVLSLRGQFLMVDTDKSGWISIDEHIAAINGMGNPWNFTEDHMKEIFNSMDANGDGKVSFEELIKAYCKK